ncbi:MAG: hypothetical protein ACJA0N_001782 [Pseudohongiellaceae bacterium]|jgi:hypothetical protein
MRHVTIFLTAILIQTAYADPPSATIILQELRDQYDGESYATKVLLRLISNDNRVRERAFYMLQKDISAEEERAIMYFHSPADVRGVSFLIANYKESLKKPDDQWIYFPAFRKVRRIGSNDKRGSFMGSAFNYSDLDKIRVTDYSNTLVGEDTIADRKTWLIERIPKNQDVINKTGYYKVRLWVDQERTLILQQHFYNAKGIVFKTQKTLAVDNLQNIWTITKSLMSEIETGKSSEMVFNETVYNVDVDEKKLRSLALKKKINASDMP